LQAVRERWPNTQTMTEGAFGLEWRKQTPNHALLNYRFEARGRVSRGQRRIWRLSGSCIASSAWLSLDTEFAVFAFVLCIALVLLVSQLVAMARQDLPLVSEPVIYLHDTMHFPSMVASRAGCVWVR
jgi:hypothetical protein